MNKELAELARERERRSGPSPAGASPATSSATKRSHNTIDLCDSDDEEPARSRCNQETADRALALRLTREQEDSASSDLAAELAQQSGGGGGSMMRMMGGGGDSLLMMGMDPERMRLSFARGSGRVRGTLADRARVGTCGFSQLAFYPVPYPSAPPSVPATLCPPAARPLPPCCPPPATLRPTLRPSTRAQREVKDKGKHEHYAERFGAVELDCLYYRVPAKATFESWRRLADSKPAKSSKAGRAAAYELVPKCNDFFTHKKRLIVDDAFRERWAGFMDKCALLGDTCPALLMQVPHPPPPWPPCMAAPRLSRSPAPPRRIHRQFNGTDKAGLCFKRTEATHARLVAFAALVTESAAVHRASSFDPIFVLEFRHASWFCEEVYALVEAHPRLTLVQIHHAHCKGKFGQLADGWYPSDAVASRLWKDKLCYVRPHGTTGFTTGDYGRAKMATLARRMQAFLAANPGAKAYAFFNNDASFTMAGEVPSKYGQPSSCVCDGYALAEALSDQ